MSQEVNVNPSAGAPQAPSESPTLKADAISVALGVVGWCISLYALIEHVTLKNGATKLACDINSTVSCSAVMTSRYSEFMGIPMGAWGMSFFGLIFATALLPVYSKVTLRWMSTRQLLLAVSGVAVSLFLSNYMYNTLGAICIVCTSVHVTTALNLIWSGARFYRARTQKSEASPEALPRLITAWTTLGVTPLVAGLILPLVFAALGGSASTASANPSGTPNASTSEAAVAGRPELKVFNTSDFVGKGEDYRKGPDTARVVVQVFADFECPHCRSLELELDKVAPQVADKAVFVFRNFPLSSKCNSELQSDNHPYACLLASAARCAGQQGRFWEFTRWAMDTQEMPASDKKTTLTPSGIAGLWSQKGLDGERLKQCLDAQVEMPKIREDAALGAALGISGTPTVYINGKRYASELTASALVAAIEKEYSN